MKNLTNKLTFSALFALIAVLLSCSTLNAQDSKFRDQAWRYGLNLGLNSNSASLGWQYLFVDSKFLTRTPTNADFMKPDNKTKDNTNGEGLGIYGGLFVEYLSESWWGVQLRASWDTRDALVKDIYPMQQPLPTPNTTFQTRMSYLSFEPAIRLDQHFIRGLSLTAGPLIAVNIHGTFDYNTSGGVPQDNIKVANRPVASLGLTTGLAYDIELNRGDKTSFIVSPFADYTWIAAQRKSVVTSTQNSANDIWSTNTFRFGVRLSWESRNPDELQLGAAPAPAFVPTAAPIKVVEAPTGKKVFIVLPADNTILTKNIKGYFPLLPYIFFDKGSEEFPSRYIQLSKADATNFKETDLENFMKGDLTTKETNVNQLMVTYYNDMNIFADRMRKNPNEKLILRGSDPEEKDGEACAIKVKNYLVDNFGIDADRITIVVESPKKPSGSIYTDPAFSNLIDQENRRVVFIFTNAEMLRPVPYTIRDESSIDNDMIFSIGKDVPFKSWDITITGENRSMYFGPYADNSERINPAELMRFLASGTYIAKVTITEQNGNQTTENVSFKLIKEKQLKTASRYLMIFEYDKSDPVLSFETKIRNEITPGMDNGSTVIIHGHTDIIGNEAGNQKLSQQRADRAKVIVVDQLRIDKKSVEVQALGIGQTNMAYTFDNKYPEGRMYNRNVFIENMPKTYGMK